MKCSFKFGAQGSKLTFIFIIFIHFNFTYIIVEMNENNV